MVDFSKFAKEINKRGTYFVNNATSILIEAKKKRKLDPKAKVRNRGRVIFPAESSNVLDNKDHFEINTEGQARNALARANQYSKSPKWYKGSLQSLINAVVRAVKKHYKKINVSEHSKKPGKK
jgi:hypothetical protein